MKTYLNNLITEKGQDLDSFMPGLIEDPIFGENMLTYETLIDFIVKNKAYHSQIRKTLVMIDFKNGDVFHYLTHLANGMIKSMQQ